MKTNKRIVILLFWIFLPCFLVFANSGDGYFDSLDCQHVEYGRKLMTDAINYEFLNTPSPMCSSRKKSFSATIQPITNGLWYQTAIWPNGILPTINDNVHIPPGITVYMAGTCRARTIEVAGTLQAVNWQVTGAWIELQTRAIHVLNNGRFEIGTESVPYKADCDITLIGNDPNEVICPFMGAKFIGAMSGATIELHGLNNKKSWTQLDETALAGSLEIVLTDATNWAPNDEIVIASTAFDMNQAEKRIIAAVNGNTITLDSPLQYTHFGNLQVYTRPDDPNLSWTLDERAEVGLLSRNITIQGDLSSEANGFGGHIMGMNGAVMNANYIELTRMGQKAKLGRYPWHWHLMGNGGQGQYITNSSVHNTFNRAITVHSTNGTVVEWNVAYNNLGHAYFFEDGNEINNVMQYNLGLVTKRPDAIDALLPSDIDDHRNMSGPSTFWITHPNNRINFNHAAGSDGSGIWFAPHQNVNSAAFVPGLDPNKLPLPPGNLDNNVAHSCTHGLLIGPTVFLYYPNDTTQTVNPNYDYYPRTAQNRIPPIIKNYTLYKNKMATYLRVGQNSLNSYWENFIIADNYKGDAVTWNADMDRILWVGGSENYEQHPAGIDAAIGGAAGLVHLHTIYDGPVRVQNSYFADLNLPHMSLFDQWGANIKYTGHSFINTTVMPGSYQIDFRDLPDRPVWSNAVVYDIDGKLSGTPMTAIHHQIPMLSDETTSLIDNDRNGAHSYNRFCYVEVRPSDGYDCNRETRQKSLFRRSDGVERRDDFLEIQGVSLVPVANGKYTYTLNFDERIPYRIKLEYHSMDAGEYVIIGFPGVPLDLSVFTTTGGCPYNNVNTTVPEVSSLENLKNTTGSAYAYEGKTLYTRYQAPAGSSFVDAGVIGSLMFCLDNNCGSGVDLDYEDSDGDDLLDIHEVYECRDPYDAADLNFEFYSNTFDFNMHHIDAIAKTPDFWLLRADQRNDPYISKEFNFNGNQIKTFNVKTKSQASGTFEFRWKTANEPFYDATKRRAKSYTINTDVELFFDMTGDPKWENQTITGIRIDFPFNVNSNIHTWMHWIKGPMSDVEDCNDDIPADCFTTYINYQNVVDNRGYVASSDPTSITISPISASGSCSGANQFTYQRQGQSTNGFADYHINPTVNTSQNLDWSMYSEISFDICSGNVPYIVYIRDMTSGYTSLGKSINGGDNTFRLPDDLNRKDEVDDIILRVVTQDLPDTNPVTFSLSEIVLKETSCDDCPFVLIKNESPILSGQYKASNWIQSAGSVFGNANVDMSAGSYIEFNPDFRVETGAVFHARIEDCQ